MEPYSQLQAIPAVCPLRIEFQIEISCLLTTVPSKIHNAGQLSTIHPAELKDYKKTELILINYQYMLKTSIPTINYNNYNTGQLSTMQGNYS